MPYTSKYKDSAERTDLCDEDNADLFFEAVSELLQENICQSSQTPAEYPRHLPPKNNCQASTSMPTESNSNRFTSYLQQEYSLLQFIRDEFNEKISEFKEYHRNGFNINGLDRDAIAKVEDFLQQASFARVDPEWPEFTFLTRNYLQKIKALADISGSSPELQKALIQANKMTENIAIALDALSILEKVDGKDWTTKVNEEVSKQQDILTSEAINRLNESLTLSLSDTDHRQMKGELTGLLFGESWRLHAENYKFGKYKKSLLAEERVAHYKLAFWLDSTASLIQADASDAIKYAQSCLYAGRLSSLGQSEQNIISQAAIPVANALIKLAEGLRQQSADLRPSEKKTPEIYQDEVVAFFSEAAETVHTRVKGYYHAVRGAGSSLEKKVWETFPKLGLQPSVYSPVSKHTFNGTALLVLDELSQTQRQLRLLPAVAWELQESVEQYESVTMQQPGRMSASPVLNALLDELLKQEADRWRGKIEQSEAKLKALLATLTRFARESWVETFWYDQRDALGEIKAGKGESLGNAQYYPLMEEIVKKLSVMSRDIEASVLRLARHGHQGSNDLNKKVEQWLRDLSRHKKGFKAGVARITGKAPSYYSREGMLARGMAEWAEDLKQQYLQETMPEDSEAATVEFDKALIKIVTDNRHHFRTEADPWAQQLLQQLKMALKHAAQNTMTYPPTPGEILAGTRSLPDDIKRWAQKKVVSGAITAAIRLGFKMVSSPVSLPGRLVLRSATTGLEMYRGMKAINRSVKLGEGPVTGLKRQFIENQLSRAGFRLTMSMLPLASLGVSAAITIERIYREGNYAKTFLTKSLIDLPEDLLWRGGYSGLSKVFQTVLAQAVEESNHREIRQLQEDDTSPVQVAETKNSHAFKFGTDADAEFSEVTHADAPFRDVMLEDALSGEVMPADGHDYQHKPDEEKEHLIKKRNVDNSGSPTSTNYPDLNAIVNYRDTFRTLDVNIKKATYYNAIKYKLKQIETNSSYPADLRENARLARLGAALFKPVYITKAPVKDVLFLPVSTGGNAGFIIDLTTEGAGNWIDDITNLSYNNLHNIPHVDSKDGKITKNNRRVTVLTPDLDRHLQGMKHGYSKYDDSHNPEPCSISTIAEKLVDFSETSVYQEESENENRKTLIHSAILGAALPEPDVSAVQVEYKLETTWENLSTEEYLRSVSRPFSKIAGQIQLIISSIKGESIQQTEQNELNAQYIGSWVDVSAGAVTIFTPVGWVFNTAQSAADIGADLAAGKDPDPLAVAGLVVGCIPGGKIAAKVGVISKPAGKAIRYAIMVGNKTIDLAMVGRSIKIAVETGEPLAIYQAIIGSGMSVKNSYDMANNISSELKINKRMEESASVELLIKINENDNSFSSEMPVRTFKIGAKKRLGRIINGEIEISSDNGHVWERGNKLDLLAYRLQNAGGVIGLPVAKNKNPHQDEGLTGEASGSQPSVSKNSLAVNLISIKNRINEEEEIYARGPIDKSSIIYQNVNELLSKNISLNSLAKTPEGNCEHAATIVENILTSQGYKTNIVGCLIYPKFNEGSPLNHYAVLAEKNGEQLVVDITFDQFTNPVNRRGEFTISSFEKWKEKICKSDKLKNKLVVAKLYPTSSSAINELSIPDESEFIESDLLSDPSLDILNMPETFIKKLHRSYILDTNTVNIKKGFNYKKQLNILNNRLLILQNRAWKNYTKKEETVPPELEDKISKLKRKINLINKEQGAQKRINNYIYLSSSKLNAPEFEKYRVTSSTSTSSRMVDELPKSSKSQESSFFRSTQKKDIHSLINKAKMNAVKTLKNVNEKVRSKNPEDIKNVDKAFEIFFGKKLDAIEISRLKEKYLSVIKEQQGFLDNLKTRKDILYQEGYDKNFAAAIFQTGDSAAKIPRSKNEPLITLYVDSMVDTNKRLSYSKKGFTNFISTALIHESYHAVSVKTPDLSYPRVHDNFLDISSIVSLSEPLLRDHPVNDIINNREILEEAFKDSPELTKIHSLLKGGAQNKRELTTLVKDRLDISDKRVWQNPDNISYMTVLISYIDKNKPLYNKFINKYDTWKQNIKTPLLWHFESSHTGNTISFENTKTGKLINNDINPSMERGFATGRKNKGAASN